MPKISLWNPRKGHDYDYIDQLVQEHFNLGGTGVYIHKYKGPKGGEGETSIGDLLFLENRDRKYETNVYELRGAYNPQGNNFDLTQFGLFLTSDTIFISFHLNNMADRLGRKLMAGDVLEFPHLRDDLLLDEDKNAINRFYVVEDASFSDKGYGPKWYPHIWRVKARVIEDSFAYRDILGDGSNADDLKNHLSIYNKELEITDGIVEEAAENVSYDPLYYPSDHFYVIEQDGVALVTFKGGDGIPPNGAPLAGSGDSFPQNLQDGDYYLRTDFNPNTLFRKDGNKFIRIEHDIRKTPWTGANQVLDTFINNDTVTTNDDGTTENEKQALSKVVRPKTDD